MPAPATSEEILDVNRRYHDVAAREYDAKWGISFGEVGIQQVLGKLSKLLGSPPGPYERSLEIGAGTGYFSLNMLQAGVVNQAVCTDISPGMLDTLDANAQRLGLEKVTTAACDAAQLPFEDESFDLVFGHAVLHHLPALDRSFAEFHRVLKPGGTLFFAGEPSRQGDRIAAVPKRAAWKLSPAWRAALRIPAAPEHASSNGAPDDHHLEGQVDVHAFIPQDLERHAANAGFERVRVRGEELLANWFGWFNRTLEASADPKRIPMPWIHYAHRGYLLLQRVDRDLLEGRLPPQLFYNLMLAAAKPEPEPDGAPPSPLELLRDPRAIVDTGVGPVAFVTVNALAGLEPAAAVAVGLQVLIAIERIARRRPVTNAIGGLLGTGLAVFIALRSGSAEGYFVPRMLYAAALAVVFAGSALIRKPLVGILIGAVYRAPKEWMEHPRVRPAFSEVTFAWAGLFAFRAAVYAILIAAGKAGWLAFASVAMGWPAFLLLLFLSYRYVPWRLARLGGPPRPEHV